MRENITFNITLFIHFIHFRYNQKIFDLFEKHLFRIFKQCVHDFDMT